MYDFISSPQAHLDLTTLKLETGNTSPSLASQLPHSTEITFNRVPDGATSQFRSRNDPSRQQHIKLIDTPGHGKLRYHTLKRLETPTEFCGVIFLVDAADFSHTGPSIQDTAAYLRAVLMRLQRHATTSATSRVPKHVPLLIAVNKLDLFTAAPLPQVQSVLEAELTRIRFGELHDLLDSGVQDGDEHTSDHTWLGDDSDAFRFAQMKRLNVNVDVIGGSALGGSDPGIENWSAWMRSNL